MVKYFCAWCKKEYKQDELRGITLPDGWSPEKRLIEKWHYLCHSCISKIVKFAKTWLEHK